MLLILKCLKRYNTDLLTCPVIGWFERIGYFPMENREMVAGNKSSLHLKSLKKRTTYFLLEEIERINFLIHKRFILLFLQHEQNRYFYTTYPPSFRTSH